MCSLNGQVMFHDSSFDLFSVSTTAAADVDFSLGENRVKSMIDVETLPNL